MNRRHSTEHMRRQNDVDIDSDDEDLDLMTKKSSKITKPTGFLGTQRYICGKIINHHIVQCFLLFCIFANTTTMGLGATDLKTAQPEWDKVLNIADDVFLIIFTIESTMQLFYHSYRLFFDAWMTFDLVIIIMSWALQNFQYVRAFRVFRASRVMIRVGPMKDLVKALAKVIPRLSAFVCLLFLVFYIFAVLFTQLFRNTKLSERYFERLDLTFFSLLQIMTLDFGDMMRETMQHDPTAWIWFVLFVTLVGIVLFNVIAAVVCDAIRLLNEKKRKKGKKGANNAVFDVEDRKRLYILRCQVNILLKSQEEIQETIQLLTEELHGPSNLPPIGESESTTSSVTPPKNSIVSSYRASTISTRKSIGDFITGIRDAK